jgi:hypothetical protein
MTLLNKFLSKLLNCCSPNDSVITYKWIEHKYTSIEDLGLSSEKLLDCTVMSSHNSTLDRYQILGTSNINLLLEAINLNFRMIELDIFHDENGDPVVSHGRKSDNLQVTSSIPFRDCIKVISEYAMKSTDLPMFITLEINTIDEGALKQVNKIMEENLNGILIKDTMELKDYYLKDLRNKYVILSNNSKINNFPTRLHNHPETREYTIDLNTLTRVYPDNVILSLNYDYRNHLSANFISMNVGLQDDYFHNYLAFFNHNGILKKT